MASKLTKRFSNGVTALVSYTWSKSIDETSGIRTSDSDTLFSQDGNCMRCERGLSAFDNRHRLVVSGLYDLPFGKGRNVDIRNRFLDAVAGGWQIGSIVTWRSGFPINPSAGVNRANTNINVDRPDATGVSQSLDNRSTAQWFNTAAFALAADLQVRQCRAATPSSDRAASTLDFSAHKDFRIKEGHELQFRMGGVQLPEPPGLGLAECQFQQPPVRPDHIDQRFHAADAVCAEVHLLRAAFSDRGNKLPIDHRGPSRRQARARTCL